MKSVSLRKTFAYVGAFLLLIIAVVVAYAYFYENEAILALNLAMNVIRSFSAPPGAITIETAPDIGSAPPTQGRRDANPRAGDDWPSYNKTLTSERFSPLADINAGNVGALKVLCVYDTGQFTAFEPGLIMVNGALIGTTEHDTFSLDPLTCQENWRIHEDYKAATPQAVNRGVAYADGMLFRGTEDGRVLAYDFSTGKKAWEQALANPKIGETTPAAPIAWSGLVFIGNAGGDIKGVKGRMYALDARTGTIVWEFYLVPKSSDDLPRGPQPASPLDASSWRTASDIPITGGATWTSYTLDPDTGLLYVPGGNPAPDFAPKLREGENLFTSSIIVLDAKTGAYRNHLKLLRKDWHDWDVSGAPSIIHTRGGKKLLSIAPKDGHLYGFDLASGALLYKTPATRMENVDAEFAQGRPVHFCPGTVGGAEWNGPAYDPQTNLIFVGEVDWCASVTLQSDAQIKKTKSGKIWSAEDSLNPFNAWGDRDPTGSWAGWLYAIDADSGAWAWRAKSNYPIQSGVTPSAGGLVFFGDMGGNFYALDAADGRKLWGQKIGGGVGGGVIIYKISGKQRIATAVGFTSILWPTEVATGKVVILGLEELRPEPEKP